MTTVGFDERRIGNLVTVRVRETSPGSAIITGSVELSEVESFTGELPKSTEQRVELRAHVVDGGTYLLHSFDRERRDQQSGTWLALGAADRDEREILQVWCRVRAVAGPMDAAPGATESAAEVARWSSSDKPAVERVHRVRR